MIIDICPFFNELDVLELRVRELNGLVDRHIVLQSRETHAGNPKPLFLDTLEPRWRPWRWKLESVTVPTLPATATPWEREQAPRHVIGSLLDGYAPDDLVLMSDVDEIPSRESVREHMAKVTDTAWVGFLVPAYYYYLNLRVPSLWRGIALARVETVRRVGAQTIRDARQHPPLLATGGWHFSYLGGVDAIQQKLAAFAHRECDTEHYRDPAHIARCLAERRDLYAFNHGGGGSVFQTVSINELPEDVRARPARYRQHLLAVAA
jgi:beta-1,4-mannosyl-glycoprotein beta-1,4-N-acetylglucosaminyltransferase